MNKRFFIILSIISLLQSSEVYAGSISDNMQSLWNKAGGMSNMTSPQTYHSQAAGSMISGGDAEVRFPIQNLQLMSVQAPELKAGCGGISLYMGGIQFPNSQKFVQFGKAVAQNAIGYAFKLGLKAVSPVIADTMNEIQIWANKINNMDFNSCHEAEALVDTGVAAASGNFDWNCAKYKLSDGKAGTYEEAKEACAGDATKNKNTGGTDLNVTFDILKNLNISDAEIDELLSILGTVIYHEDGRMFKEDSLISDKMMLKDFIGLGDNKITLHYYECTDKNKCLNMDITSKAPITKKLYTRIDDSLKAAISSSQTGVALGANEEKTLEMVLNATNIPVYKYLNVLSLYSGDSPLDDTDREKLSKLVTTNIVSVYISRLIANISQKSNAYVFTKNGKEIHASDFKDLKKSWAKTQNDLYDLSKDERAKFSGWLDKILKIERLVHGELSAKIASVMAFEKE